MVAPLMIGLVHGVVQSLSSEFLFELFEKCIMSCCDGGFCKGLLPMPRHDIKGRQGKSAASKKGRSQKVG